jgi:hypothetical protein
LLGDVRGEFLGSEGSAVELKQHIVVPYQWWTLMAGINLIESIATLKLMIIIGVNPLSCWELIVSYSHAFKESKPAPNLDISWSIRRDLF